MANVIVCCDGTWNTPDDIDGENPTPTNVVKLFNALDKEDAEKAEQRKYYHPGVGTEGGFFDRLAGGGIGLGLDRNIMSGYKWLAVNYRPGDQIFLFGFSRGAYTVRSLAGMIGCCGLADLSDPSLDEDLVWRTVEDAFACYRAGKTGKALKKVTFHNAASHKDAPKATKVFFLGVWDTVGALGIPDDLGLLNLIDDPQKHSFHDTELSATVLNARHAVAMNEMRQSFTPTLWTNTERRKTVKQAWFPGVHSDVGGGYVRTGLSDGALDWMVKEAKALGLGFRTGAIEQIKPDFRDVLHDSRTGVFERLKTLPRNVPYLDAGASNEDFHSSVIERHDDPPLSERDYWPAIRLATKGDGKLLTIYAREKWNATWIYLEAGVNYRFTATGQWLDRGIKCGPAGTDDGKFEPGEVFHIAASAIGKLESVFRRLTDNQQADFWMTRREEKMPWFALVGVVASGVGTDGDGNPARHEVFLIGDGVPYTPKRGGYLYCFANDAWQAYDNNRGSVSLNVRRA